MEVRFQQSGKLYSQMLRTLRHEFLTSDLTARARHVPGPAPAGLRPQENLPPTSPEDSRWERHEQSVRHVSPRLNLTEQIPEFRPFERDPRNPGIPHNSGSATPIDASPANASPSSHASPDGLQATPSSKRPSSQSQSAEPPTDSGPAWNTFDSAHAAAEGTAVPGHSHLGFQVHSRYLVTQDETGMVVVDQHALHERILYEQLRQKSESRSIETQKMLVPEPIDLTPSEAAAALDSRELLAKIGIEIEHFGGDTVLLTAYPAILARLRPAEILRQVIDPLLSGGKQPSAREMMDNILHMLACKAAIKAGDKLAPEEITALLEQRDHYQDTHHCPHGRPTALFFSREQLDKMFGRT